MNGRDRILATLDRRPVDRTPIDCWLYQKQFLERLEADYGPREKFLEEFGIDVFVGLMPYPNQYGHRFEITDLAELRLEDPKDPKWLNFSAWNPDFGGTNIATAVRDHQGKRAVLAHCWGMVEGTSSFLGIENCWMYLGGAPDRMAAWFDRYADWMCLQVDMLVEAGVDIMTLSDDWGSNGTMLFSPKSWRQLIKPYAMRVVQFARSRGLHVNLHSDGYILQIVDDIIEMGYHSWHPVQESAGMDPREVKAKWGDKITIYGSLDVVDGLLKYDGDELDAYITERFGIYAPGGGFIFNGGHFIQPDIPPARLIRAYRLVNELAPRYRTLA
jgi:uroporphyrinogen-III decarboxylase